MVYRIILRVYWYLFQVPISKTDGRELVSWHLRRAEFANSSSWCPTDTADIAKVVDTDEASCATGAADMAVTIAMLVQLRLLGSPVQLELAELLEGLE